MAKHSHRQTVLENTLKAEKKEEHKHIMEFFLLFVADMCVRVLVEPDHVKHGIANLLSIFGQ